MRNKLAFVICVTDSIKFHKCLLSSPCFASSDYTYSIYTRARSAAEAFNLEMELQTGAEWLVWVHQDVFLPEDWDSRFIAAVEEASLKFSNLAVVGAYGVVGTKGRASRVGTVLDRDNLLLEPTPLPCLVDSIDEYLFAVRIDSQLMLDPFLKFDFYGTDLTLQAKERGYSVAVLDVYCEHRATTPRRGISKKLMARVVSSGRRFEKKWCKNFPLETTCFSITRCGDIEEQCHRLLSEV